MVAGAEMVAETVDGVKIVEETVVEMAEEVVVEEVAVEAEVVVVVVEAAAVSVLTRFQSSN